MCPVVVLPRCFPFSPSSANAGTLEGLDGYEMLITAAVTVMSSTVLAQSLVLLSLVLLLSPRSRSPGSMWGNTVGLQNTAACPLITVLPRCFSLGEHSDHLPSAYLPASALHSTASSHVAQDLQQTYSQESALLKKDSNDGAWYKKTCGLKRPHDRQHLRSKLPDWASTQHDGRHQALRLK